MRFDAMGACSLLVLVGICGALPRCGMHDGDRTSLCDTTQHCAVTLTPAQGRAMRANITVGLLGPMEDMRRSFELHAAYAATARVNAENPGFNFTLLQLDDKGVHLDGTRALLEAHNHRLPAIIGPAYSGVTRGLASLLKIIGMPTLSPSATSPTLSNVEVFPTFSRVVASDSQLGHAVAALLRHFGLRQFGTFSGADEYERHLIKSCVDAAANDINPIVLADGAAQAEFDFMHATEDLYSGDIEAAVTTRLRTVQRSSARVIVLGVVNRMNIGRTGRSAFDFVAAAARRLGMFGSDYVWILPDAQDNAAEHFPDFTLALRQYVNISAPEFQRFQHDTAKIIRSTPEGAGKARAIDAAHVGIDNQYPAYFYDAVQLLAKALLSELHDGAGHISNTTRIVGRIRATTLERGATGAVVLDANGDRSGMSYALLSLAEGKRREVGLIGFSDTASAWRVSVDDSLLWPGGRTEPPHDNYLEPGSGNQTLLFASLISTTLVLCLCGVVGYLLRRNRQLRKAPTKDEHGRITIQMPDPAALLREHISDAVFSELEQHWYICFEELMVTEQQLGAGGSGQVFAGCWCNKDVAIKQLPVYEGDLQGMVDEARGEVQLLVKFCQHPNIVQLHGISMRHIPGGKALLLVMERCSISLDRVIRINSMQQANERARATDRGFQEQGDSPRISSSVEGSEKASSAGKAVIAEDLCQWVLSQDSQIALLTQVCIAMRFLHKNGVVHRDIKPGNILLDESATVKIADFGCSKGGLLSKHRVVGVEMTANIGTPVYMAPELYTAGRIAHYSNKCDVYAFALVAWSVFTSDRPYDKELEEAQLESVERTSTSSFALMQRVHSGLRPRIELPQIPPLFQELLPACWHQDPKERPSFDHILRKIAAIERPSSTRRRNSSWLRARTDATGVGVNTHLHVPAPENKLAPAPATAPISADDLEASLAPVMQAYRPNK